MTAAPRPDAVWRTLYDALPAEEQSVRLRGDLDLDPAAVYVFVGLRGWWPLFLDPAGAPVSALYGTEWTPADPQEAS